MTNASSALTFALHEFQCLGLYDPVIPMMPYEHEPGGSPEAGRQHAEAQWPKSHGPQIKWGEAPHFGLLILEDSGAMAALDAQESLGTFSHLGLQVGIKSFGFPSCCMQCG